MKRQMRLFALTAAALLVLAGCGGQGGASKAEGDGSEGASPYSVEDVRAIADAGAFSEELEELDGDTAFALYKLADYGLEREELADCAVLRSAGATCEETAVLVLTGGSGDAGDSLEQAETAAAALEDYVKGQIAANEDYRPGEIPKLEEALVRRSGNTVLLVVANDLEAAKSAIE